MSMHEYEFTYGGNKYVVQGPIASPPDLIVLPDHTVLRTVEILETFPTQIGKVEAINVAKAKAR